MKVFISYRREDSAGHSGRLFDSLQARFGQDGVFMDLSGIDSGQNFVDVIHNAIRSSDVLIAVIGKEWLTCEGGQGRRLDDPNDFVRTEIAAALERGTPIIPVLVDGTAMPPAAALPDVLKPLAIRDAHELSDERWSYDVGRLIEATEKLAGKSRKCDGNWSAEVTYDWGAKHTERFVLKLDDNEILGTASYLGSPRGIVSGTLNGDRVLFQTRTQVVLGEDKPVDVVHRYRGKISGDAIAFYMQSEGGTPTLPIEFTARRVTAGK